MKQLSLRSDRAVPFSILASLALAGLAGAPAHAQGPPGGGLPPPPPPPLGNPTTQAKINLGKTLFWDEQLSSTRTMACASCHIPAGGGSDPRSSATNAGSLHPGPDGLFGTSDDIIGSQGVVQSLATGEYDADPMFGLRVQVTSRKAPSAINAAYAPLLFWDGRAAGSFADPLTNVVLLPQGAALENQAIAPILSNTEMAHDGRVWADVVQRVTESRPLALSPSIGTQLTTFINGRSYPEIFQEAFGTADVTPARIAMAIATYERILFANQTPFDAFLSGNPNALTTLELQGFNVFNSPQALCNTCHTGPLLTNQSFQYTGVRPQNDDLGRFNVTGNNGDRGRMKTPGLRNLELRSQFFHNGSARTIEAVIDFYDRGGDFSAPNKAPQIHPLNLTTQQKQALAAFMRRPLTDPRVASEAPPFDHPALYATSSRAPLMFGTPTTGTGGFSPRIIALSPPIIGNPSFTIGVDSALGGVKSVLVLDTQTAPFGTPFQGATAYVAFSPGMRIIRAGTMQGAGAGQGWDSVVINLPDDAGLIGTSLFGQWFVLDPGASGRFAATAAFQITHF